MQRLLAVLAILLAGCTGSAEQEYPGGHPHCYGWGSVMQFSIHVAMASADEGGEAINGMANDMLVMAIDHLEELECKADDEPASS